MELKKGSFIYTAILYSGIVLGYINVVLVFPNVFNEENFGLTRILISAAAVLSQFALLGLPNFVLKFHPFYKDKKFNPVFSMGTTILTIGIFGVGIYLMLFKNVFIGAYETKSPLFASYFFYLIPFFIATAFFGFMDAYLRSINKNVVPLLLNNIVIRLLWLLFSFFYWIQAINFDVFVLLFVGAQILIALIAFAYLLKSTPIHWSFKIDKIASSKKMLVFSLFTTISGISAHLINKVDILIIGQLEGLIEVAIYSIAAYMSMLVVVPTKALARTATVRISTFFAENDVDGIKSEYKTNANSQLLFGTAVFTLLWINYDLALFFLNDTYKNGLYVFLFLSLAKVIDTGLGLNGIIIINSKYYKWDLVFSLLLLVLSIFSNYLLIPLWGIQGAAIATAISIFIYNCSKALLLKIKFNFSPFSVSYLKSVLLLGLCFLVSFINISDNIWINCMSKTILYCGSFVVLAYQLKVSLDLNRIVNNCIKKI